MTPARLAECITTLDWTQRGLARRLGRGEQTIRQWLAGTVRIPSDVAAWLEKVARFVERNPPPARQNQSPATDTMRPST